MLYNSIKVEHTHGPIILSTSTEICNHICMISFVTPPTTIMNNSSLKQIKRPPTKGGRQEISN